jgi:hypothetical protein
VAKWLSLASLQGVVFFVVDKSLLQEVVFCVGGVQLRGKTATLLFYRGFPEKYKLNITIL